MHHMAHQWWEREQERKENSRNQYNAHLINNQLHQMIRSLKHQFVKDKGVYESFVKAANRHLQSCSLWDIKYLNNLENPEVSILQYFLVYSILDKEEVDYKKRYEQELRQIKNQIMMHFNLHSQWKQFEKYLHLIDINCSKLNIY